VQGQACRRYDGAGGKGMEAINNNFSIICTHLRRISLNTYFRRSAMVCDDTKRVVVIRNIASNFIEEAILILKGNPEENGRKLKRF